MLDEPDDAALFCEEVDGPCAVTISGFELATAVAPLEEATGCVVLCAGALTAGAGADVVVLVLTVATGAAEAPSLPTPW